MPTKEMGVSVLRLFMVIVMFSSLAMAGPPETFAGDTHPRTVTTTPTSTPIPIGAYYISPSGSDSNNGLSQSAPFKTFKKAFTVMSGGNTLVLLDGTYTATTTGYISNTCTNCAMPPNGLSASQMTTVMALNEGSVQVQGDGVGNGLTGGEGLTLGTDSQRQSFIKIQGITFAKGAYLYATDHIYIKNVGITSDTGGNSVFSIGQNNNSLGNSYILVEDSWAWGNARKVVNAFRADHVVFRRFTGRLDGCQSHSNYCGGNSGNYVSGITTYNSNYVSHQNMIFVDNTTGPGGYNGGGADFWTAWHVSADNGGTSLPFGQLEWLGNISLKSEFKGFYGESGPEGTALQPTFVYKNDVAWGSGSTAIQATCSSCSNQNAQMENITAQRSDQAADLIYMAFGGSGNVIRNAIGVGSARNGVYSNVQSSYMDISLSAGTTYQNAQCTTGCKTSNPLTDGSLKYITRIEAGSPLKGTGFNGGDYGANVMYRYGVDGAFYDDPDFNALTNVPLWPWPNEDRVKKEMCTDFGVTRGFCGAQTLTKYVWEYLGNPIPPEIYGASATPPSAPGTLRIR